MARQPRVQYEGAFYHVMARGDRRQEIFRDAEDHSQFVELLGLVCARTGWKIHSWVMMGNHFHWLLETPEANLVTGMKWFMGVYTQKFNRRHRLCGHLFQGRYKAIPIENGEYLLRVSDYIHLNPARASILDAERPRLESYIWSSYAVWAKGDKMPIWSPMDQVLRWCGLDITDFSAYRARMAQLVRQTLGEGMDWSDLKRGWALGGEDFIKQMVKRAGEWMKERGKRESYAGEPVALHGESRAEELIEKGLMRLGLKEEDLEGMNKTEPRKRALVAWVKAQSIVGNAWLAKRLQMGHCCNVATVLGEEESKWHQILTSKN
jgi:putative transposase